MKLGFLPVLLKYFEILFPMTVCLLLEKEMATHSSILAWRIPGTEEPSGLPSMGSQSRTQLKRLSSSSSSSVSDFTKQYILSDQLIARFHVTSGDPQKQKPLSTQLRLVFNLTDYQVGPITIVHVNRILFLERVTHDKSYAICLSPQSENKHGRTIEATMQTLVLSSHSESSLGCH